MLNAEKEKSMTRKEYLKHKKASKKRFPFLKNVILLVVILILIVYVSFEFHRYNTVTELANKVMEESKLIKTYKIFFMGKPYTKDDNKNILYKYTGSDESRDELENGLGLSKIQYDNGYIYGVLDDTLIKIDTNDGSKTELVKGNVNDFLIYNGDVYFCKYISSNSELNGLYDMNDTQIIQGTFEQVIASNDKFFVVTDDKTSKSLLSYTLDGNNKKNLSDKYMVTNIIAYEDYIYYINASDNNKIYRVNVNTDKNESVTTLSAKLTADKLNGSDTLAVYSDIVIFINSKDNKIYKVVNGKEDILVDNSVKLLQLKDNMLYFALKDKIDIYRYNLEKNTLEKITSARTDEMICLN